MQKCSLKGLLVIVVVICTGTMTHAQGYKISMTVAGTDAEELYLGYYLNSKTYVQDTASRIGEGKYVFQGHERLARGMYFVAENTRLIFDLVVGEDQEFELKTSLSESVAAMRVVGDHDNSLFFDHMNFNLKMRNKIAPFMALLEDTTATTAQKTSAQSEIESINNKVAAHQDEIISNSPGSVLATLLKSTKGVEIPTELQSVESESDRQKKLWYYRNHYWDYFDLGDPTLLRLPNSLYKENVDNFLDNLVYPEADSIKNAVDELIGMAKKDESTYRYLVWHLTIKYQESNIMGMDEVFVHLVDQYFLSGEMNFWANDQLKKNLKERSDEYRYSLVGMEAPNLILQDLKGQPRSLNDMKSDFTIIYFYDPDCGHCKKETPVLKSFVDSTQFDVGVYSVSADTSMAKMANYIEEQGLHHWINTNGTRTYSINYKKVYDAFTTPTIYVLNDKKEIIAKKVAASQLEEVLLKYTQSMPLEE